MANDDYTGIPHELALEIERRVQIVASAHRQMFLIIAGHLIAAGHDQTELQRMLGENTAAYVADAVGLLTCAQEYGLDVARAATH